MKTKTHFLYLLLLTALTGFAQDPAFLNTSQSLVYLNPSFAGSNGGMRNQLSYYNQWANNNDRSFATALNTFDAYLKPLKGGVAISVLNDNGLSGKYTAWLTSLTYAQHLGFLNNSLKIIPSVQVSYGQKKLDLMGVRLGEAFEPRIGFIWNTRAGRPMESKAYVDLNAGLLLSYKKDLYAGVSVAHINGPDVGLLGPYNIPVKITAHASYNLHVSERTLLNIIYRHSSQGIYTYNQVGVNAVFFKHLIAGAGLVIKSYSNVALISAGYRNNFLAVALSYDRGITENPTQKFASYGLNLSFNLRGKDDRKRLTSFEAW